MASKTGWLIGGLVLAGGLLLACGACGGLFFWMFKETSTAAKSADEFLALLGQGKVVEAYNAGSSSLRSRQDQQAFEASMKQLGVLDYASSSWTKRDVENNVATLVGAVTTKAGGTIPLTAVLVKEGSDWKVQSLVSGVTNKKTPPTDQEAKQLAKDSLLAFNQAVKAKDFTAFHASVAALWKRETTAEKLQAVFQEFITKQVDIGGIRDVEPVFDDPPSLDNDERYVLKGYFPTKPSRVKFDLKYTYEHPDWKLVGINVQVVPD
jgi:hypothetical protein